MADQWDWWRAARKGVIGPVQEARPQSGYYRHYIGSPVAIWRDAATFASNPDDYSSVIMLLDDEPVDDPVKRGKVWLQVVKGAVTKAAYDERVKTGNWPTDLPELPSQAVKTEETEAARGPGDNSGDLDTYQRMRAEILGDVAEAEAFFAKNKITDKTLADKAEDWGARLVKSSREAEKARLAENEPLRKKIEENDKKWRAISGPALVRGEQLRAAAAAWGKAEVARIQKEREDEQRKQWEAEQLRLRQEREAAAEAARKAREAQAAHDADGVVPEPEPEPEPELLLPPPPPVAPPPKLMLGTGTSGNRRSVKTAAPETATITDLVAAASFFAKQSHPELLALVQKLADRAIKARAEIPGIRFSWQQAKTEAAE